MAASRDTILNKLRAAQQPFAEVEPVADHLPMVPLADTSPGGLLAHFVEQAEKLGCVVYQPASPAEVSTVLREVIGDDDHVLAWDSAHIPLDQLEQLIAPATVAAGPRDDSLRVGITGADAGLAATGSLVLATGEGKHRATSLLPPVHVAILCKRDITTDLESWAAQAARGSESFRQTASAIVISGPSRTADIAMQLIMGMHGPAELHILLVD